MRLLDSDTCIHILRVREACLEKFAQLGPGSVFVSAISYHELYYGALYAGAGRDRHLELLDNFIARLRVLPFTSKSAERSATVRQDLAAMGTPIGPLDTLIAGHALEHELTLVTGNIREFSHVEGLTRENWSD